MKIINENLKGMKIFYDRTKNEICFVKNVKVNLNIFIEFFSITEPESNFEKVDSCFSFHEFNQKNIFEAFQKIFLIIREY